jgi:hypothetical protein
MLFFECPTCCFGTDHSLGVSLLGKIEELLPLYRSMEETAMPLLFTAKCATPYSHPTPIVTKMLDEKKPT